MPNNKHAFLSPSAAHRWLNCPAAPALEHFIGRDAETVYAREGSLAHAFAAKALAVKTFGSSATRTNEFNADLVDAIEACGDDNFDLDEMARHADGYAAYITELVAGVPGTADPEYHIEIRVDIADGCWGTSDCYIIKGSTLIVVDYKYGMGVKVDAKDNPQLLCYALGAMRDNPAKEISRVIVCIFQPRAGGASLWNTTADYVRQWGAEVLAPASEAAHSPVAEPAPGEWCRWCAAKIRCLKLAEAVLVSRDDPRLMTNGELARALTLASKLDVAGWHEGIKKEAARMIASHPGSVPGWRLRPGRTTRVITDPDALAGRLRAEGVPFEMVYRLATLTDLERAAGKKLFAELSEGLVGTKTAAPVLAPDDKAEAPRTADPSEAFANIDFSQF